MLSVVHASSQSGVAREVVRRKPHGVVPGLVEGEERVPAVDDFRLVPRHELVIDGLGLLVVDDVTEPVALLKDLSPAVAGTSGRFESNFRYRQKSSRRPGQKNHLDSLDSLGRVLASLLPTTITLNRGLSKVSLHPPLRRLLRRSLSGDDQFVCPDRRRTRVDGHGRRCVVSQRRVPER